MNARQNLMLWTAQGFGVGWIPVAPGTFGSVLGLLWCALLLCSGQLVVLLTGSLAAVGLSIWLCGAAEKLLGKKDPGSVVLDEVSAMPLCFVAWICIHLSRTSHLPRVDEVFSRSHWLIVLGVFACFRFFDVLKPWPVRQSQALPGGWGITIDDLLAAVYVNLVFVAIHLVKPLV